MPGTRIEKLEFYGFDAILCYGKTENFENTKRQTSRNRGTQSRASVKTERQIAESPRQLGA